MSRERGVSSSNFVSRISRNYITNTEVTRVSERHHLARQHGEDLLRCTESRQEHAAFDVLRPLFFRPGSIGQDICVDSRLHARFVRVPLDTHFVSAGTTACLSTHTGLIHWIDASECASKSSRKFREGVQFTLTSVSGAADGVPKCQSRAQPFAVLLLPTWRSHNSLALRMVRSIRFVV